MIVDALTQLSAAQAVTASAVSTNTMDLGVARDMAPGKTLYAVFAVDIGVTGGTSVTFQVITSAAANLGTPTVIAQSDAVPVANLGVGRKPIGIALSPAILNAQPNGQRYLGVQYTVGGGPLTTGSFTAYIVDSLPPGFEYYASGFTVV